MFALFILFSKLNMTHKINDADILSILDLRDSIRVNIYRPTLGYIQHRLIYETDD